MTTVTLFGGLLVKVMATLLASITLALAASMFPLDASHSSTIG